MKRFAWDARKNALLSSSRGVTFEDALIEISEGRLLAVLKNKKYPGQLIYVISLKKYVHCVPAVEERGCIRLITIFPSRKLNAKHGESFK